MASQEQRLDPVQVASFSLFLVVLSGCLGSKPVATLSIVLHFTTLSRLASSNAFEDLAHVKTLLFHLATCQL